MVKSYQLVAWTDKGQVKMIPSEIASFLNGELDCIKRRSERIRYGTRHEIHDILKVSYAHEKLALQLLDMGLTKDAFVQFSQAATCCCTFGSNWISTEWGEVLCKPLRGRFFAMFRQCKDIVRKYPNPRYVWEKSGLQDQCDQVTCALRMFETEWNGRSGDFWEAQAYTMALNFGKDELYRRRRV